MTTDPSPAKRQTQWTSYRLTRLGYLLSFAALITDLLLTFAWSGPWSATVLFVWIFLVPIVVIIGIGLSVAAIVWARRERNAATGAQARLAPFVGIVAALGCVIAWLTLPRLIPYIDPSVPFRFERFEGPSPSNFFGVGQLDVDGANAGFLKEFPVGTRLDQIERYFVKVGGHCSTTYPSHLSCNYGHSKYPFSFCLAQVWLVDITYEVTSRITTTVTIRPWIDGC